MHRTILAIMGAICLKDQFLSVFADTIYVYKNHQKTYLRPLFTPVPISDPPRIGGQQAG